MDIQRYPLCWLDGKPRTAAPQFSRFRITFVAARNAALDEIFAMGGKDIIISSNIETERDGLPYPEGAAPEDGGVAIYFMLNDKQYCFACDQWKGISDNLYAIAKTVHALRGIERWMGQESMNQVLSPFQI